VLEVERHRLILTLVQERSVVPLAQLMDMLGVSEATVRRDVQSLAQQGRVRRIRGGVESLTPRHEAHLVGMPFELSRGIGAFEKAAIARAAVSLVQDGDSIIITGGTTTYAMVEYLADRQLDILTNSIPIVTGLLARSRNRVTLPGGTIYREQNIVLGAHTDGVIGHFWARRLFTGCYGLNRFGLMEIDPLIVQSQMSFLHRAEELVVLADSRKFQQRSSMIVAPVERIHTLITDSGATDQDLQPFRKAGVEIVIIEKAVAERPGDLESPKVRL
jgi:DeoR family ulaG and ulaABCDEF operon transcriptional repressor